MSEHLCHRPRDCATCQRERADAAEGDAREARRAQARVAATLARVREPLGRIRYWASVNYEDAGEMANAVDKIAEAADQLLAILDGEGEWDYSQGRPADHPRAQPGALDGEGER